MTDKNAFMVKDDENTVRLYWQKRKRKVAAVRYQNPLLKRLEEYEVFVDEDVFNGSNLWFDDVIWIKNGGFLFDNGGNSMILLTRFCMIMDWIHNTWASEKTSGWASLMKIN